MPIADIINRLLYPIFPIPTPLVQSGRPKAPIKAILFDVYGTILVSASGEIHKDTGNLVNTDNMIRLLERYDINVSPQKLKQDLKVSILNRHDQIKAKGIKYPEIVIESIWESLLGWHDKEKIKIFAIEYELVVNPVWPMPHLWTILKRLHEKNIFLGIISNAQFYTPLLIESFADASLKNLGFDPDLIFFSYQYGRAKPSDFLFKKAANTLVLKKIDAKNILYLGNDMLNDILPAQTVGFQTALLAGDARSLRLRKKDPDCCGKVADMVITDLDQLIDFVH